MHDLDANLGDALARVAPLDAGEPARYIPALAAVDPDRVAVAICTAEGRLHTAGNAQVEFSLQSVSKPFTYALALSLLGFDAVDDTIDVEPSGEGVERDQPGGRGPASPPTP